MLLPEPVWLTPDTLDFFARRQGLTLPSTLRPEPLWRDREALRALTERATTELKEQGLTDRGAPSVEFVIAIRGLCAGEEECFAFAATKEKATRLHAGVSGNERVFARYVRGGEKVELRDAKADTVVEEIVNELTPCPPARAQTITCRVQELTGKSSGVALENVLRGEAKRMAALHNQQNRTSEVKMMVAVRDANGRRHTSGKRSPVVLDVEPGERWVTYLTGEEEDPYLNARAGDRAAIVEHVTRELDLLREQYG